MEIFCRGRIGRVVKDWSAHRPRTPMKFVYVHVPWSAEAHWSNLGFLKKSRKVDLWISLPPSAWTCSRLSGMNAWVLFLPTFYKCRLFVSNYGLEHWGSDDQGKETTRRFLLEWLSFLHRYVPVGLVDSTQKMNQRPPHYFGRCGNLTPPRDSLKAHLFVL